jgi:hypothetical protein
MNSKTRENGEFQWTGWVVGGASLLLLLSDGLELFVQQTLGHYSMATFILALFLAFWSYVLGLGVLLFLSVRCLVNWRRMRLTRTTMSRRSEGLEEPGPEGSQFLEHDDVSPIVPSRLSRHSDDPNKGTSSTRVA